MPKSTKQSTIDSIDNLAGSMLINNFLGGLNTNTTNDFLNDNESIVKQNWGQSEKGALEKVNGFTKKNATLLAANKLQGLFRVYKSSGSDELLAICNGVVSYSDNEGTTFTGATGGTGLSSTDFFTGVNYNDLFFFTGITNNLYHYTPGTNTVAAATNQPSYPCKILLKRADRRMLALVNTTFGSTLYWSKVDPTGVAADDWSATNDAGSIAVDGSKSDPLTGCATLGTYDLIFKDYTVFKVWNYPSVRAVRIIGSPGCAASYSISQGEGYVFSLSHKSVDMWDGISFLRISEPIREYIEAIPQAYIQNSFGVCRDGYYWLFFTTTGQTTNTFCFIYDIRNSNPYDNKCIWYQRTGLSMNCPLVLDGVGDNNELYAGDSASTGFVYQLDSGTTDNTANISAVNQTKYFNAGYPNIVKRFPKIFIEYYNTSGTFTVDWYTNKGATSGSYTITETAGSGKDVEDLPDTAIGYDISIKITHTSNSTAPIIKNIEILWEALYVH